ncbi:MAG: alpha-hydroxy-acid oxidizing enzyme [Desulfobacterales bacterium]|nr:MAG: alpha-hydroxy-acid oxidizing enzyme [Desulfobacterales bacterium]
MTIWYCSVCGSEYEQTELPEECSDCRSDHRMIVEKTNLPRTLEAVRDLARKKMKGICAAYPSCDGSSDKICQRESYGKPIGLGGVGKGLSFRNNIKALDDIKLKMSVLGADFEPDTRTRFLGIDLAFPILPSSTAGAQKYNDALDETDFCKAIIKGAQDAGTIALRGDTWFYTPENNPALEALDVFGGAGIAIFKPRSQDVLKGLIEQAERLGCRAVGVDLDGAGSTIMARHGQPVFRKSETDLKELVSFSSLPFIAKGVMRPDEAARCAEAGVACVGVSNHGGRVLDSTPGTAEVLPLIRAQVGNQVTLTVDGGVRTGYDVLKMLALGADAVLLGRDIIRAAVGSGAYGVRLHLEHVAKILKKAMFMTGAKTISEIDSTLLF